MKSMRIIAITIGLLATAALYAQTGITPSFTTTADAVHYRNAWTAGTTQTISIDLKDSLAGTNGYVDSLFVGGMSREYGAAGFSTYGGYAEYVPTKTLASFIKSTNIPADSFRVYARGGLGTTVPAVGKSFFTGFAGAGVSVAVNQSGSVVWDTAYFEWQNPGIAVLKSGLQIYFGGAATSPQGGKAAVARRALKHRQ